MTVIINIPEESTAETDLATHEALTAGAHGISAFGATLIDDANASAARTTLGLGTLATQSGTFSGTSSGTNTGDQTIILTGDVTGSGTGSFAATIASDSVTYAKIQNVSTTDKILGRSTAGAGDVEEITCTAAGRALIDDADASAQRTTLGLGSFATISSLAHSSTTGLTSGDDHTQYAQLAGRAGNQELIGGTGASGTLTLKSTSNATKGKIILGTNSAFDESTNCLGLGTSSPSVDLEVASASAIDGSDPTTVMIRSTTTSSSWTVDGHWARLDFKSDDGSGAGNTTRARIAASTANAAGGQTNLVFFTDAGGSLTEAFRFTSNAYAQIGGNTASSALAVSGSTAVPMLRLDAPASHTPDVMQIFSNSVRYFSVTNTGTLNVGTQTTTTAKIHSMATTEQIRLGYDASNYFSTTVGSTGGVTFDAIGSGAGFTFSDSITLGDAKDLIVNATTGTKIGTATTQKLGFYNATPIVQRSGAAQAAVATTAATNVTPFGYTTAAQADAIITLLNELRAWAVAQGFIKGAA